MPATAPNRIRPYSVMAEANGSGQPNGVSIATFSTAGSRVMPSSCSLSSKPHSLSSVIRARSGLPSRTQTPVALWRLEMSIPTVVQ